MESQQLPGSVPSTHPESGASAAPHQCSGCHIGASPSSWWVGRSAVGEALTCIRRLFLAQVCNSQSSETSADSNIELHALLFGVCLFPKFGSRLLKTMQRTGFCAVVPLLLILRYAAFPTNTLLGRLGCAGYSARQKRVPPIALNFTLL